MAQIIMKACVTAVLTVPAVHLLGSVTLLCPLAMMECLPVLMWRSGWAA